MSLSTAKPASTKIRLKSLPTFEIVPLEKIKPFPGNPRTNHAVDVIAMLMERYGFTSPILVQKKTYRIIAGHGRREAALKAGLKEVPVAVLDMDDKRVLGYTIADNKSAELAETDFALLEQHLVTLQARNFDLKFTAIPESRINDIVRAGFTPPAPEDLNFGGGAKEVTDTFTATAEQAKTIDRAINEVRAKMETKVAEGVALEYMAHQFINA